MKTWLIASGVALALAAAGTANAENHGTRNGAIAGAVGGAVVGGPVGAVVGGVGGAVVGHSVDKHRHGYATRWCYTRHHHHRYVCR